MNTKSFTVTFFDNQGKEITKKRRLNWREQQQINLNYKMFKFVYLDKQGNVLDVFARPCRSKQHAFDEACFILKVSLMKGLHSIKTEELPI